MKSFIAWAFVVLLICGGLYIGLVKQERIYQESQV